MFDKKKLDRINELVKKNKEGIFFVDEIKEREILRKEYLENFRVYFRLRLDSVKVVLLEEYE